MEKKWEEMTVREKQDYRFEKWLYPEGIIFENPEAEADYKARITRMRDAIQLLKTPDRVPVFPNYTFMPADLYNETPKDMMYDPVKMSSIWMKYIEEYNPDCYCGPSVVGSGQVFETLDYRLYNWPGHGVADDSCYQCLEDEYMKPEDYRALIDDPSDFWMRTYLPRICGAFEPFRNIPPLTNTIEMPTMTNYFSAFGTPEVQRALSSMMETGKKAFEWAKVIDAFEMSAMKKGYVNGVGGMSKAPFDYIADTLRGTRAMMLDMFRRRDEIIAVQEQITPILIKMGLGGPMATGNPIVFMPLHKGADGFMSDEQFRTLYWPFLKAVILGLIDEGCVPFLFAEGSYDSRLDYLNELPKGHCFWLFDRTDMVKAKEIMGSNCCIAGNVPAGMIMTSTPERVKDYCKDLIDNVGKGGGFIMSCGTAMDEGKPETLHAMIDFTKEYGVYS